MNITVFIADDHAMVRDGFRFLLESQTDIKVIGEASQGNEAVAGILKLRPHITLMDIAMQRLNGIEATQHICQAWPEAKIIMLSMLSNSEYIVRALQAGAQGYLVKESAGSELLNAVRVVHSGRRYLSQQLSDQVLTAIANQNARSKMDDPLSLLSQREREILQLVAEGKSSAEIGSMLGISAKTVETYRSRFMQKLNLHNVPSLVKFALQHGLISLP
jgi:RNA polymerase sigma factor (sigma-70 family)